jgi:hypothetical protein
MRAGRHTAAHGGGPHVAPLVREELVGESPFGGSGGPLTASAPPLASTGEPRPPTEASYGVLEHPESFQLPGPVVALLAWLGFFGALGLEAWINYAMRMADGDVHDGGLPNVIWFGLHGVFFALALAGLLYSARGLPWPLATAAVLGQLAIGVPLYLFACVAFAIGAGIDHF